MRHILLIVFLFTAITSVRGQAPTRTMAVTIDDLPYVKIGEGPYIKRATAATAKILSTLKKHKVPAVGFVNEGKLEQAGEREARIELLRQWVKHGMVLANHTYSHPDFNLRTIEQFQEEITKGEVVTRELMRSHGPYQLYFRHPMTHTGDTREKKEAIEKFLNERGYKVTPHTIENSDFVFNVPYAPAVLKGDETLAKRLRDEYLNFTIATTEFAEKISTQIFGREIPQILLIHTNDVTADALDEMLQRLAQRGYTFVTLDKVMSDPAYATKDTYVTKYGPTWFFRWSKSKGLDLNFDTEPETPPWVMNLYNNR